MFSKQTLLEKLNNKELTITPYDENSLGPVSYELHLGNTITVITPNNDEFSGNAPRERKTESIEINDSGFLLLPKCFVITKTLESLTFTSQIVGIFEGKASLAQVGLFSHIASTLIEPEHNAPITCELFNSSDYPIRLYKGQKIGQIYFSDVE